MQLGTSLWNMSNEKVNFGMSTTLGQHFILKIEFVSKFSTLLKVDSNVDLGVVRSNFFYVTKCRIDFRI